MIECNGVVDMVIDIEVGLYFFVVGVNDYDVRCC